MEVPGAHGVLIVHALNHAMAVISSDLGNVTMPLQFRVEVLVQDLQWKRRFATNLYRVQVSMGKRKIKPLIKLITLKSIFMIE